MAASESVSTPMRAGYTALTEFGPPIARRRSTSQAALDAGIMMTEDVLAVLLALCLASVFRFDLSPTEWHPTVWAGHDFPIPPGYLVFFVAALLIINRRDGLYGPPQAQGSLNEQRKTIQACLGTGLLLCGGLYLMHNSTISRVFRCLLYRAHYRLCLRAPGVLALVLLPKVCSGH